MTSEQVDLMLGNYRAYVARCGHLHIRLKELEQEYDRHTRDMLTDLVKTTSVLTDMPRGGKTSDPTGQLGTRMASGYKPEHLLEIEDDIQEVKKELDEKEPTVLFVEAWLKCLSEREVLIVQAKYFEGMSYADVIEEYNRRFGRIYSKNGMKMLLRNAMDKIYEIAS